MVDARGFLCPMPVVMVQKEVKANNPDALDVLVDDPCAVENVTRFAGSQGYTVTVTEDGAAIAPLSFWDARETDFFAENLICHYRQEILEDAVVFTLYRSEEDQQRLLALAEKQGVRTAIGLYQELHSP